ncbi:InlB B-repeat-containing protein [Enterococcus sp. LJL99]
MKKRILVAMLAFFCFFNVVTSISMEAEELEHYTVVFDPDNGTSYPTWFKTEVEDGSLITEKPADPEKAGYKFIGWYHTLDESGNPILWDFNENRVTDNTTLWAAYEQTHTVVFDPDNGTSYPTWFKIEVEDGSLITEKPADPEKVGYKFIGWYHALDESGNPILWDFNENRVTDNTTLWAAYEQTHTVVFDPDNGTSYPTWFKIEVEDGSLITEKPADPEKAGYKFIGWYHALDESGNPILWDFNENRVTDNITLWAAYEQTHTVVFDPDNGTSYPTWFKIEVEDGSLITEKPADPEKAGYKFIGWYHALDESGNPILWDFNENRVTDNITLWAAYVLPVEKYPVDFNSNGGSIVPSQSIVENATVIKPNDPTKEGYTFVGWYVDEALTQLFDFNTPITQAMTLYAKWTKNVLPVEKYPVDFNSNGGSIVPSQSIVENATVIKPNDPTKEGYTFAGWYVDEALTQLFDFNTPITQATTLYAKWTKNVLPVEKYPVDFNSNGGSLVPSQSIAENATVIKPNDPTKEGYTFAGWYVDEALTQLFDFNTPITQATTLYAKWTENVLPVEKYPVDFNSNGGSLVPSQSIAENATVIKPNDPIKEGYTFAGWYVDEALTQLFDFNTPITQATTLYAKWMKRGTTEKNIDDINKKTINSISNNSSRNELLNTGETNNPAIIVLGLLLIFSIIRFRIKLN